MTELGTKLFAVGDFFQVKEHIFISSLDEKQVLFTKYSFIPKGATGIVSGIADKYIKVEVPGIGEYLFGDKELDMINKENQADFISKHDCAAVEVDD